MRIKLDENLPAILVPDLVALGHDVDTAVDEGLGGRDDSSVWAATQVAGRILVTQDLDFSDVRAFVPGTHHGLVLVRLRQRSRARMHARVLAAFNSEDAASWDRCLVVIGDSKVRVRRPPPNA
jgi:predicted nuclease of predicted toxin-antitoxin system